MLYRKNIDMPDRSLDDINSFELGQLFLLEHYSGKLPFEVLRLLAILDVVPAAEIIKETEPDEFRKLIQLEKLDIDVLESTTHQGFLLNIALRSAQIMWCLIQTIPVHDLSYAISLGASMQVIANCGGFLSAFSSEVQWPVHTESVIYECNELSSHLSKVIEIADRKLSYPDFSEMEHNVLEGVTNIGRCILILIDTYCEVFSIYKTIHVPVDVLREMEMNLLEASILFSRKIDVYDEFRLQLVIVIYTQLRLII
jgi:hypothetical protein